MTTTPFAACIAALALAFAGGSAHAAGALAVGNCGAYGTAFGHDRAGEARRSALSRCSGSACQIALTIRNECAAFAVQRRDSCGARGWAYAPTRAEAEDLAMRYCHNYGGRRCRVRAWVCDERG